MNIFVIMASGGSYDDRWEEVFGAVSDEQQANALVGQCNQLFPGMTYIKKLVLDSDEALDSILEHKKNAIREIRSYARARNNVKCIMSMVEVSKEFVEEVLQGETK